MKTLLPFLFLSFIMFYSCGETENKEKLMITNVQAFAYDIGDNYEVNILARIDGFVQESSGEKFKASLAYEIDLIKPSGDTIKSLVSKVVDKSDSEEMIDTQLDIQFNLDSTYSKGKYEAVIRVRDAASEQEAFSSAYFEI